MFVTEPQNMGERGDSLTVADFFAGAGGFSEGFRQKGFDVVFALDNWEPAVRTHELNHPEADHVRMDIKDIETAEDIDDIVPDVDVIIGGPPCVNFSMSNQAGKADKTEGLNLIECMLRIIAWKKEHGGLKYWVLENVPNTRNYIKDRYTWEDLQLPGDGPDLVVPKKPVHLASAYGVPQDRRRMFAGNYPDLEPTHPEGERRTVREVFEHLGDPLDHPGEGAITDPNFGIEVAAEELTDHFYDSRVEEYRWKRAKRLKVDHGFMGRMDFPEDLDRPSRTVMATRSASTREAMIFEAGTDDESYRLPTVREIACLMSYPITYQFDASTEAKKYRLVGNSVPAKMSAAIAGAIAEEEGTSVPDEFPPLPDPVIENDLTGRDREFRKPRKRKEDAKFERHVPFLKVRAFRPELVNTDSDFEAGEIRWTPHLHKGVGRNYDSFRVGKKDIERLFRQNGVVRQATLAEEPGNEEEDYGLVERLESFIASMENGFSGKLPDAETFQDIYTRRHDADGVLGPHEALEEAEDLVNEHFPKDIFEGVELDNTDRTVPADDDAVPVRVAAGQYAVAHIAEQVNGS